MNHMPTPAHSRGWIGFCYVSFAAALAMVGAGIVLMPTDVSLKAYLGIGMLMLVQSCITLTKAVRDDHEGARLINRLEDAKTEELLAKAGRS